MRKLTITDLGEKVQGVRLNGNPRNPEPESFRVVLPFGDVDVVRCDDGTYWVHLRVNRPGHNSGPDDPLGVIHDARLDAADKHAGTIPDDVLRDPALYHVAIRFGPDAQGVQ